MKLYKIYSKRIFSAKYGHWDETTDFIFSFAKEKKLDPYFILSLYYIESYYRPKWLQKLEIFFFRYKLLKNPSIGPFQIQTKILKVYNNNQEMLRKSLSYLEKLYEENGLDKNPTLNNFKRFSKKYNPEAIYGDVIYDIWKKVKKEKWVLRDD